MAKRQISLKVFRFDPNVDVEPRYEVYKIPYEKGMTVLNALMYINDNIEPIAFRYECRYWNCGSCGVIVDGYPVLACKQRVKDKMTVDPLLPPYPKLRVIKDLVVDTTPYWEKRSQLRPFLERTKSVEAFPEPEVTYKVDLRYKDYVDCVDCLCCQVVCEVLKRPKKRFIGPAFITYLARFAHDPRDELDRVVMAVAEGLEECTLCGKCNEVCPKGRKISEIDIMRLVRMAKSRNLL